MRLRDVIIIRFINCYYKTMMFFCVIAVCFINYSLSTSSTVHFTPPTDTSLRRLAVDSQTGRVYVGAVNHIYQLDSNLSLVVDVTTGPVQDDKNCGHFNDTGHPDCASLKATHNYNQVTIFISYCFVNFIFTALSSSNNNTKYSSDANS